MAEAEYNRILTRCAQTYLTPLGCFKLGTRTWILDRGYWLALVELQPNKLVKASNVECDL
jgi:hypothetical protein